MKKVEKLMDKYFKSKSQYSNTLSEVFDNLCDIWLKNDKDGKINLLSEDNEEEPILCRYYSDETLYLQRLEVEYLQDGNRYLNLYVRDNYGNDDFILDEKEWISEDEVLAILIEMISMHLGYDLDNNAPFACRNW